MKSMQIMAVVGGLLIAAAAGGFMYVSYMPIDPEISQQRGVLMDTPVKVIPQTDAKGAAPAPPAAPPPAAPPPAAPPPAAPPPAAPPTAAEPAIEKAAADGGAEGGKAPIEGAPDAPGEALAPE